MKKDDKAKLAKGLGASRVVEVGQTKIGGPLDMLALSEEFNELLCLPPFPDDGNDETGDVVPRS